MPIHWDIEPLKLQDEVNRLKDAGMKVTYIIPVLIEWKPNDKFMLICRYAIMFEE